MELDFAVELFYEAGAAKSGDGFTFVAAERSEWAQVHAAMATWAAKDIPARLYAAQVAKLLNCTTDDVAVLVSAGKLRAFGKPRVNGVKYFNAIELITLLADPDWLDEATKTIGQFWRRKNARRHVLAVEKQAEAD